MTTLTRWLVIASKVALAAATLIISVVLGAASATAADGSRAGTSPAWGRRKPVV